MTSGRRRATSAAAVLALVLVPGVWSGGQESVGATAAAVPAPSSNGPVDVPGPVDLHRLAIPFASDDPGWPDEGLLGRGRGLARYTGQRLQWHACGGGFSCTTVQVPLDYDDLTGRTVDLAVNRLPAASSSSRLGSLLVNPGGPGGSGLGFARSAAGSFGARVLAAYDIVGFDPRGVGSSDPFVCVDSATIDQADESGPDLDGAAELAQGLAELREFSDACTRAEPFLLPHLSTTEVARDVDVLRAVLGDTELHWFGASYGTYIGAVYAELFPRRVGRLVLDGALDPTLDATELPRQQAAGFETALRAYVADCVTKQGCPLGVDTEAGLQRIRQLLADLDAEPLPTDDPARPLTQELGVSAVIYPLYVPHLWSGLTVAIGAALNGNGRLLLNLVDLSSSRTEGEPPDDSWQARTGVNCSDRPAGLTVAGVKASLQSFRRAAPTFGRTLAWSQLACVAWPVRPSPPPRIDGNGAAPILVVGTSRDPATPLRWAVALAGQLESGVLLTRDGDGHTAYGMGNACVDRVIDRYLVGGRVPQDGTAC